MATTTDRTPSEKSDSPRASAGRKSARNAGKSLPSRPTFTKLRELEMRAAGAYRLAIASLQLPYGSEALESSASSHELRALRIDKHLAASATDQSTDSNAQKNAPSGATTKSTTLFFQRAANLLGPHAALASLERRELRLRRVYEAVDVTKLSPALRLLIEAELYPEQLRTLESISAGKDSYR